jgi:hypothetical protein
LQLSVEFFLDAADRIEADGARIAALEEAISLAAKDAAAGVSGGVIISSLMSVLGREAAP